MEQATQPSGRWPAAALIAGVFAASVVLPWTPLAGRTLCLFAHLTGQPCPGCGLGRSFVAITHGDWAAALSFHPLGLLAYVALAWLLVRFVAEGALRRRLPHLVPTRARRLLAWSAAAGLLIVWAMRLLGVLQVP